MIYTIQKRHEFGGGTMTTHYEVMSYTHRTQLGILVGEKTLKKGTKKQCEKYCRTKGIVLGAPDRADGAEYCDAPT